jgi:flagellin
VKADDGASPPVPTWTIKVGADDEISLGALDKASSNEERLGQVVAAINAKTADTGVTAFLEKQADGKYALNVKSERMDATDPTKAATVTIAGMTALVTGVKADGSGASGALLADADVSVTDADVGKNGKGIDAIDITTQANAWVSLKKIDDAMDEVNAVRGQLGALQTRFEKTVENIDIMSENVTAARGRIVDADFAKETANLSRAQILQQAGTAMVAQANQLPQSVLSLLK